MYEKYRACWRINTAWGKITCCICLETPCMVLSFFIHIFKLRRQYLKWYVCMWFNWEQFQECSNCLRYFYIRILQYLVFIQSSLLTNLWRQYNHVVNWPNVVQLYSYADNYWLQNQPQITAWFIFMWLISNVLKIQFVTSRNTVCRSLGSV